MKRNFTPTLASASLIALAIALAALVFFAAAEWRQPATATRAGNITITGKVYQGEAGDRSTPLAGHPVMLTADDQQLATQTSDDGSFAFTEVELPAGYPIKLSVETCEGCQAAVPQALGGELKPLAEREAELTFQNCGANEECFYPVVEFFVTRPASQSRLAFTRHQTTTEEKGEAAETHSALAGIILPPTLPLDPIIATASVAPASVVDVTAETGQFMTGALTSWQTPDGPYNVEHLAGRNTAGDLITLYWSPRNGRWLAVNVTQATGYKITGAVTSWQTRDGSYLVEHLAGRALNGDLIVFYWSPASGGWRAVNVTQKTGQKIANTVTSWQTPNGSLNVEHLAGVNPLGQLIAFWWSPAHDWQAVNLSAKTGVLVNSQATDWQVRSGGLLTEYLAATNASNQLFVFSWSPAHDWQAVNVT
ncbi:MAG: hypothetical protein HOP19_20760, partial [Acidobacteria bacterium]|nr:hypothetical protein [Acidobacteriota bacterium]